jgi:hypothetical protein
MSVAIKLTVLAAEAASASVWSSLTAEALVLSVASGAGSVRGVSLAGRLGRRTLGPDSAR